MIDDIVVCLEGLWVFEVIKFGILGEMFVFRIFEVVFFLGGVIIKVGVFSWFGEVCRVEDIEWVFVLELVISNGIFFVTLGEIVRVDIDELGCFLRGVVSEIVVYDLEVRRDGEVIVFRIVDGMVVVRIFKLVFFWEWVIKDVIVFDRFGDKDIVVWWFFIFKFVFSDVNFGIFGENVVVVLFKFGWILIWVDNDVIVSDLGRVWFNVVTVIIFGTLGEIVGDRFFEVFLCLVWVIYWVGDLDWFEEIGRVEGNEWFFEI